MRAAILVALVLGLAPPAPAGEDEAEEIFSLEIGRAPPWLPERIVARSDGSCEVSFGDGVVSSDVKLTPEDLKEFTRLVGEESPPRDEPKRRALEPLTSSGPRPLILSLRTFRDDGSPFVRAASGDLASWLERLMSEAAFVASMRRERFVLDWQEYLHPEVFRTELERALAVWDSPHPVVMPLAQLISCEEWTRAIEKRFRSGDGGKVDGLASALASLWYSGEDLPSEYREAYVRLLCEAFEREYAAGDFDEARGEVASEVANALCRKRYQPALPLVVRMIERTHGTRTGSVENFGADALDPLARLLESPDPGVRATAVRAVRSLACSIDDFSGEERKAILERMHVEFTLKIREIARHDPDGTAQTLAGHALVAIARAVFGG